MGSDSVDRTGLGSAGGRAGSGGCSRPPARSLGEPSRVAGRSRVPVVAAARRRTVSRRRRARAGRRRCLAAQRIRLPAARSRRRRSRWRRARSGRGGALPHRTRSSRRSRASRGAPADPRGRRRGTPTRRVPTPPVPSPPTATVSQCPVSPTFENSRDGRAGLVVDDEHVEPSVAVEVAGSPRDPILRGTQADGRREVRDTPVLAGSPEDRRARAAVRRGGREDVEASVGVEVAELDVGCLRRQADEPGFGGDVAEPRAAPGALSFR